VYLSIISEFKSTQKWCFVTLLDKLERLWQILSHRRVTLASRCLCGVTLYDWGSNRRPCERWVGGTATGPSMWRHCIIFTKPAWFMECLGSAASCSISGIQTGFQGGKSAFFVQISALFSLFMSILIWNMQLRLIKYYLHNISDNFLVSLTVIGTF